MSRNFGLNDSLDTFGASYDSNHSPRTGLNEKALPSARIDERRFPSNNNTMRRQRWQTTPGGWEGGGGVLKEFLGGDVPLGFWNP